MFSACKKDRHDPKPDDPDPISVSGKVLLSGKEYPTVKIGDLTWLAGNYDGNGGVIYNNGEKPEYGRYYTYAEALAIQVPQGWRIPTREDYNKLMASQGIQFSNDRVTNPELIKRLASKTNWKNIPGNNISGFNAQPAGYMFNDSAPLDGDISELWIADGSTFSIQESGSQTGHIIRIYGGSENPVYRFNLRFVR